MIACARKTCQGNDPGGVPNGHAILAAVRRRGRRLEQKLTDNFCVLTMIAGATVHSQWYDKIRNDFETDLDGVLKSADRQISSIGER